MLWSIHDNHYDYYYTFSIKRKKKLQQVYKLNVYSGFMKKLQSLQNDNGKIIFPMITQTL